jgi:1-acyl-sn-glycerol-3-phosphate acyltransferase
MIEIIKFISRLVIGVLFRVEHINIEKIPNEGSGILCANHVSDVDMFFIGCKLKRLIRYMAKEELFQKLLIGKLIKYFGAFPVRRGAGDIGAIRKALDLLKEGHIIGIFPEGTIRKKNMKLNAKPGPALIAMKSGAKIIPVKIEGKIGLFSKIKIIYGNPYYLRFEKDRKYKSKELSQISQDILDNIYSLSEEEGFGNSKS